MQYFKHPLIKSKQPQHQKRTYNQNYHLQRFYNDDKNIKLLVYRCDICNDDLTQVPDNFEERMKIIDDIDDSFKASMINQPMSKALIFYYVIIVRKSIFYLLMNNS